MFFKLFLDCFRCVQTVDFLYTCAALLVSLRGLQRRGLQRYRGETRVQDPGGGKPFLARQKLKRNLFKKSLDKKFLYCYNDIIKEVLNMKSRDIIRAIMEAQSVTNATLAHRLGITNAAIWDRLNNKGVKDLSVSTLSDMARNLDYKVVVVPRNSRIPEGGYEVD